MLVIRTIAEIVGLIGLLVAAIGSITYKLFQRYGEKWLDTKFDERLAAYKHEQQKELEQLRFKINALLDRTTKLHQREFEVLPEAWAKLTDAYHRTLGFVAPLQSYPDLNKMSPLHLKEFLEKSPLGAWEKAEIEREQDRTRYYIDHIFWHRLVETRDIVTDAHAYIFKNGIFLPNELKTKFTTLSDLVFDALWEHQSNKQHEIQPEKREKQLELRNKGPELIKDLETDVHHRLWNSERIS